MKFFIVILLLATVFSAYASITNNYLWGVIGQNDEVICNQTVSRKSFIGRTHTQKFVFKQDFNNALTITAIEVKDLTKKNGAMADLKSGGPGSKGATIIFTSGKGEAIKDRVIIYGR